MRRVVVLAIVCALVIGCPRNAFAQSDQDIGGISGQVTSNGSPLAGALVQISGAATASTTTDSEGRFALSPIPLGVYTMRVSKKGFDTVSRSDILVTGPKTGLVVTLVATAQLKTIGSVEVKAGQGVNLSPAAISSITTQTFHDQGEFTWRRILDEIPGVSIQGSPDAAQGAIPGSPADVLVATIRGAEPYETATLIDGHHFYGSFNPASGVTELQGIDPNSFARIDVVRGPGATAPTINNAIGGSLNFIADQPVTKRSVDLFAQNDGWGGETATLSATGLALDNRLDYRAFYGSTNFLGPFQGQHALGPTFLLSANGMSFSCQPGCSIIAFDPAFAFGFRFATTTNFVDCCVSESSSDTRKSIGARLGYKISPVTYASLIYTGSAETTYDPDPIFRFTFQPTGAYSGSIPAGSSVLAASSNSLDMFKSNFPILEYTLRSKYQGIDVRYSYLSTTYYTDRTHLGVLPSHLNFFGNATVGGVPQVFNGETESVMGVAVNQLIHNTQHNRDSILEFSAPSHNSVATLSFETTSFDVNYTGLLSIPAFGLNFPFAAVPGAFSRYSEIRLRDIWTISDKFEVTGAYYLNDYQNHVLNGTSNTLTDVFTTFSAPRFGLLYRPARNAAIRFAVGQAISPIPLATLDQGATPPMLSSSGTFYIQTLSPGALLPEVAESYDLGADYQFPRSPNIVGIDLYSTRLQNQFFTQETSTGTFAGKPLFTDQVRNLGTSAYRGIEFEFNRNVNQGLGGNVSFSLMRGYTYNLPPGFYNTAAGPLTANLGIIPDVNFDGFGGIARIPYAQGYAELNYRTQRGAYIAVGANYYGHNNAYFLPAFVTLSSTVRWPISPNVYIQLSGHNLTNAYSKSFIVENDNAFLPYATGQIYGLLPKDSPGVRQLLVGLGVHF